MKVIRVAQERYTEIERFLINHENRCVPLLSKLKEKGSSAYALTDDFQKISGIVVVSRFFQILPFFSNLSAMSEKQKSDLKIALCEFCQNLPKEKIFCVIGEKNSADEMISALKTSIEKKQKCKIHYELLEKTDASIFCSKKELDSSEKVEVSLGTLDMNEEIFPLQKEYESEEVAINGNSIDEKASRIILNKALSKGLVYVLKFNGKIVSKLSINGKSENYVQLGGIFTLKEYRGNKFAKILTEYVCEKYINSGKKISLFVKTSNDKAKKLYSNCGFKKIGDFTICYY